MKFSTSYKKGEQDGETLDYYENGDFKKKSFLKNNEYYGEVQEYFDNGNLKMLVYSVINIYFLVNGKKCCECFIEIANFRI